MDTTKRAVTLVELLIAISLMAAIVLGAMAFDTASRRFFVSTRQDVVLLNELGLVLDHLNRNINLATGDASNPGIRWEDNSRTLRIRIDDGNPDPGNYAAHKWATYSFVGNEVRFENQVLTNHLDAIPTITTCCTGDQAVFACVANCLASPAQGGVRISGLRLRDGDYVVSIEDATNPPSDTIYFFPFSHSWN